MANSKEVLSRRILDLLLHEPEGLEAPEVHKRLDGGRDDLSPRGVRNQLNRMSKRGELVRRRRVGGARGAPPYVYLHPEAAPHKPGQVFEDLPGVMDYAISTKSQVELRDLDREERDRFEHGKSVLDSIAAGHLHEERYARAVIDVADALSQERPVDLIIEMAQWAVDDLNRLGDEIQATFERSATEADALAGELELRLGWTRRYFQRFWRLDPTLGRVPGILDLPNRPRNFFQQGERARLDRSAARERLRDRVGGERFLEELEPRKVPNRVAVGTDASVADLFLDHSAGSFIPPESIAVMTAAAALKSRAEDGIHEYHDFDIFPDRLEGYADHTAAIEGLVISPLLRQIIGEEYFKHSRMAAMDLRQYHEDFRTAFREAKWRPVGEAPLLGVAPRPKLIFRDGRVFPSVYRIQDYEDDGLYGQIVRGEVEKFAQVVNHALSGVGADMVYGSVVKSPGMSWLSPLVFWYLHARGVRVDGSRVVHDSDVYRTPFGDTAVSHLLFVGMAKRCGDFSGEKVFVTFRAVRRFSDIAVGDEGKLPPMVTDAGERRALDEDSRDDWEEYVRQRINERREHHRAVPLVSEEYLPFLYLCAKVGVSMFHAAPTVAYRHLGTDDSGHGGHFLLPRLEVAVDMARLGRERDHVESVLSWLATGGGDLDHVHTQSTYETGNREHALPILVPDVIVLAHEAATFARIQLGEEVEDKIKILVRDLRRWTERRRA